MTQGARHRSGTQAGAAQYPAHAAFTESVEAEAEQNVKRLRHHPSIVIFGQSIAPLGFCRPRVVAPSDALLPFPFPFPRSRQQRRHVARPPALGRVAHAADGCRTDHPPDYQIAESLNLELDYADETSDFRNTNFPARWIYERLLPAVVERLCDIHYHRSSPYSGFGKPTNDKTCGDLHQCQPAHRSYIYPLTPASQGTCGTGRRSHGTTGTSSLAASSPNLECLFTLCRPTGECPILTVSALFYREGYPDIRTVDYWLGGNNAERYPQSRCVHHLY